MSRGWDLLQVFIQQELFLRVEPPCKQLWYFQILGLSGVPVPIPLGLGLKIQSNSILLAEVADSVGQWQSVVCRVSLLLAGSGVPWVLAKLSLSAELELLGGKYSGGREWCLIVLFLPFLSVRMRGRLGMKGWERLEVQGLVRTGEITNRSASAAESFKK